MTVYIGQRRASNGLTRFIAVDGTAYITSAQNAVSFLVLDRPVAYAGSESFSQNAQLLHVATEPFSGAGLSPSRPNTVQPGLPKIEPPAMMVFA
jgi:hypothetical protein